MKMSIASGLMFLVLIAAAAPKNTFDHLDGTWTLIAGESDGVVLPEEHITGGKLILDGERYSVALAGKASITGTQKLDATQDPKHIDITDANGANKGKTCLGIYELKGDEFRVAFAAPGKSRPTKFATAPESGQWLHVWKHVKE